MAEDAAAPCRQRGLDVLFGRALAQAPDGFCVSRSGVLIYANRAAQRLLGSPAERLYGGRLREALCARLDSLECAGECPLQAGDGERHATASRGKAPGGALGRAGRRALKVRCLSLEAEGDGPGQKPWTLTLIEETSKDAERERRKRLWRGAIAVDLRSPLSAVASALRLAGSRESEAACRRLLAALSFYLDIGALRAGALPLRPEAVDLLLAARRCVLACSACAAQKGVEIGLSGEAGLSARADSGLLARVIGGLLDNAIRFAPAAGTVRLSAGPAPGSRVALRVINEGRGMPSGELARIFEPCERVPPARVERWRSTGLALTFCREAVGRMGGEVLVESTPGSRTAFTVLLPAA
ncbi:MAG: PAS domain-containing sensor histidine kinase [Elusimicrobia bacterium]|nr:PAS domain-containing sensor histidine kinase [Elusimicrobiota bacterium]MDE2236806.1 PAS domain-containing sensor histidine kinase [Elusimicrobiota bacterium]MDE2424709.1 PAS domain-containing sensor histidine kinase [Elusimicrobiota bacterium]